LKLPREHIVVVFNSLTFVVFFALVCFVHYLPLPWKVKKWNLLVASYLFYAAWNPPFVLLLVIAAIVDFHLARLLDRTERPGMRRLVLASSLILNLGILGYFKYGSFLLENFVEMLRLFGVEYRPPHSSIILPLGISFYTFETISYLVDVYRRKFAAWDSFLDYALFLTFFPHLVAGPIVRGRDFLPQCQSPRVANRRQIGWGLSLLALGLFEKVILADAILAPVVDKVYGAAQAARFVDGWVGTLAFSGQIFFDFAGYTTCAIGAALVLGFVLNDNFRFPYAALGFSDFWQRWHISLSSWLRDYLYIPLGGNRKGGHRTNLNLMLTMLLGGLWHGAAWRFVAWGGLHGGYLVAERGLRKLWGDRAFPRVFCLPAALVTFGLVSITWVFFRASDFHSAFHLLSQMLQPSRLHPLVSNQDVLWVLAAIAMLLGCHWLLRNSSLEEFVGKVPWWVRSFGLAFMIVCLVLAPGDDRAFIYFQF
jgi:D-alanyl-lipoteichoic acid acyltransferase DltB (MBOAT superfamily)